jgi:hypothetical protein
MNSSINDLRGLLKNENYKKYYELKLEIQSKYPIKPWLFSTQSSSRGPYKANLDKYTEEEWEAWVGYKKEILDLMLEPNGPFQEFLWDIVSDYDKEVQERRSRGRINKRKIEY